MIWGLGGGESFACLPSEFQTFPCLHFAVRISTRHNFILLSLFQCNILCHVACKIIPLTGPPNALNNISHSLSVADINFSPSSRSHVVPILQI